MTDRLNPRLQVDGILATMYDGRTLHSREVVRSVVDHFQDRVFHTVITRTAGTYALVEKGSSITDAENTANIPQTGDDSNVAVFALLALAAAGMMGVTLVTRKRKSNEA